MRSFSAFPVKPYIGQYYSKPVNLCGGRLPAKICPIDINWITYGASTAVPNMGVQLDLQTQAPAPILSNIVSVYIDNTDSKSPIFILFEDTGFVAVAQPNSTLWLPVITALTRCTVYGLSFTTGAIPQTKIFLCDQYIEGFSDIERLFTFPQIRSSQVIPAQSIFTNGFSAPSMGDQVATIVAEAPSIIVDGIVDYGILIPRELGKILVINSISFFASSLLFNPSLGEGAICQIWLDIGGASYFRCGMRIDNAGVPFYTGQLLGINGANVNLQFTHDVRMLVDYDVRGGVQFSAVWSCTCVYTVYDPLL